MNTVLLLRARGKGVLNKFMRTQRLSRQCVTGIQISATVRKGVLERNPAFANNLHIHIFINIVTAVEKRRKVQVGNPFVFAW